MSEPVSKDSFYETKEKELRKANPKKSAIEIKKKVDGAWKLHQEQLKRKEQSDKKQAKNAQKTPK